MIYDFSMTLSYEFIIGTAITLIGSLISVVVWLSKLESKTGNNSDHIGEIEKDLSAKLVEQSKAIYERINEVSRSSVDRDTDNARRIERAEVKADQTSGEVRAMLLQITRSLAQIEGKLSINSKEQDR